jgi:hypothetical protein
VRDLKEQVSGVEEQVGSLSEKLDQLVEKVDALAALLQEESVRCCPPCCAPSSRWWQVIVTVSHLGFSLDSDSAQAAVTLAVSAGYYVLFRLVERTVEHFGGPAWLQGAAGALLGWARPPHYQRTDDIATRSSRTSTWELTARLISRIRWPRSRCACSSTSSSVGV